MSDSAFRDLVAVRWTGDVDSTADAVARSLRLSSHQRGALIGIMRDEIRRIRRFADLSVERSAFYRPAPALTVEPAPDLAVEPAPDLAVAAVPLSTWRVLLNASFAVDTTGRSVTWGKATRADHLARIGLLEAQRAGLARTAAQHREVLAALDAAGVDSLEELITSQIGAAA